MIHFSRRKRLFRELFPDIYNSGSAYTLTAQRVIERVREIPEPSNMAYTYLAPFIIERYIKSEVNILIKDMAYSKVIDALKMNECRKIDYTSREAIMIALFGNPNRVKKMRHFNNMEYVGEAPPPLHFPLEFRFYENLEKMSVYATEREGFSWSNEHSLTLPKFKELSFRQDVLGIKHDFSYQRGLEKLKVSIHPEGVEDNEEYQQEGDVMITVPLGIRHLKLEGTVCLKDPDFSHLKELKTLKISKGESDYISDIPRGLDRCNKLKELSLRGLVGIDNLNLLGILPGLTRLKLIYTSIRELNSVLFPNLQQLEIEYCEGLSGLDLSLFPKLRSLKVSECDKVEIEGVSDFLEREIFEEIEIMGSSLRSNSNFKHKKSQEKNGTK
jgi:hypothetical protein